MSGSNTPEAIIRTVIQENNKLPVIFKTSKGRPAWIPLVVGLGRMMVHNLFDPKRAGCSFQT
jgi:hypothetical protein